MFLLKIRWKLDDANIYFYTTHTEEGMLKKEYFIIYKNLMYGNYTETSVIGWHFAQHNSYFVRILMTQIENSRIKKWIMDGL